MAQVGAPYSYSFEGQKQDVPLSVDAGTGPEGQGKSKKGGERAVRFRRGRKGKKH